MLTSLKINHFNSCHGTDLYELGPVTVLIGKNGAGKSNILQAIQWLARTASVETQLSSDSADVTAEFKIGNRQYRFSARAVWTIESDGPGIMVSASERLESLDSNGDARLILYRSGEEVEIEGRGDRIKINGSAATLPSLASLLPADHPVLSQLRPVIAFFSAVHYYPLDEVMSPNVTLELFLIQRDAYVKWRSSVDGTGYSEDKIHFKLLQMHLEAPERLQELKSLLGSNGLGIIDDIRITEIPQPAQSEGITNRSAAMYMLQFNPAGASESTLHGYFALSHGTRRILRMLVSLLLDDASVMLIEHPEDGIHAGLLKKLMALMREYADPIQEIIASHSASLFDMLGPSAVRLVSISDGRTTVKALSPQELVAAEKYIRNDGPLSDFLESIQDD